ncbi:MAG: hypothetical protein KBS57_04775 [Alistipes sp.]|nr:hypothetical protein [Candidatus Minthomonas equi]
MKKITLLLAAVLFVFSACQNTAPQQTADGIPSDEGMFPFVISFTGEDNATDISSIVEAPAGKNGFIRVENGHFVNDKGRVKFNATNLTCSANFPSHEQAERLAARIARFGINCVRLHFMDCEYGPEFFPLPYQSGIFANDGSNRNLDPERLDRLEYMIHQFKEHGIYVDVNLYVARYKYAWKGMNAVNPYIQSKEKEYAKDLLTHVNPYTGLSMANDPCVAVIELNNEDALFTSYMGGRIRRQEWPTVKELRDSSFPADKKREFFNTLEKFESDHWNNMYTFLKKEVGVKAPITSTQVTYSMPSTFEGMDFYDIHAYWQHPHIGTYWKANNIAMINDPDGGTMTSMASRRYSGKPFTVSEYNHAYPNFYGTEAQPMLHAYAAFHGWDGVFAYSWNNRADEEPQFMEYFFSFAARTDVLAHFIACAAMYLRGDVQESPTSIVPVVPMSDFVDDWMEQPSTAGDVVKLIDKNTNGAVSRQSMLMHKTIVDIHGGKPTEIAKDAETAVKITDTKEIEWNNEIPDKGMFIVRTPNVKLFSGFPEGRNIDLGDAVSLKVGATKLGWTTISLTSLKGNGFGSGSSTLLAATGYTHNKDARFTVEKDENGNPTTFISSRMKDWGTAPIMTEGINATVTLASDADATSVWALDPSGDRMTEVPVSKDANGKAVVTLDEKYQTVWYEISVR